MCYCLKPWGHHHDDGNPANNWAKANDEALGLVHGWLLNRDTVTVMSPNRHQDLALDETCLSIQLRKALV